MTTPVTTARCGIDYRGDGHVDWAWSCEDGGGEEGQGEEGGAEEMEHLD